MIELPKWPDYPPVTHTSYGHTVDFGDLWLYQTLRTEAALTRLRLLANAAGVVCKNTNEAYGIQVLRNALAEIGELP